MARLLLVVLSAATLAAAPSAATAALSTLQVATVGGGQVTVRPAPIVADPSGCSSPVAADRAGTNGIQFCTFTYEVGTTVQLVADGLPADDGPATSLARWSDDRCPPTSPCTWIIGPDRETVAALFTPQRLSVKVAGAGGVTSTPNVLANPDTDPAGPCATDGPSITCVADVPLGTPVRLDASPVDATSTVTWLAQASNGLLPLCDNAPPPCSVTVDRPRWASVGFGVDPDDPGVPPEITVAFRVHKAGSGTGTVRSGLVTCGDRCSSDTSFGRRDTLTADPDPGSRFDRWGAACGTAPTCTLAVGPVTALTAFFERGSSSGPRPGGGGSGNRALRARVLRLNVRGHGRRRAILIRLQVNAPSFVRAVLLRGRRQVTTKRFRVEAGTHVLRLRVPVRARPGSYRVRLTIQGNGQTKRLTRRVRLRR
ncbi:MAG TPA: hypothetical protein VF257_11550 [Solirubrobacteraceae bacterium]